MVPYQEGLQTSYLTNTTRRRSIAIGTPGDSPLSSCLGRMISFIALLDTFSGALNEQLPPVDGIDVGSTEQHHARVNTDDFVGVTSGCNTRERAVVTKEPHNIRSD